MKDILIIREENNFDKPTFEYLKNKYVTSIIDYSAKDAEFALVSEGMPLIVAFVQELSPASLVELRRIIM